MEKITDIPLEDLIATCRVLTSEEILDIRNESLYDFTQILVATIHQKHQQIQCDQLPVN